MSWLSGVVLTIQKVYRYEKTGDVDKKALQSVMIAFAVVLFLIDIENYHLGKFGIGMVTFAVGIVSVLAAVAVNYLKNIRLVCRVVVFLFLLFSVPISVLGANEGFSLLWYLLLPVITLVLLGMPFGAPICIAFGFYTMVLFWTPLKNHLLYAYPRDYLFYYPIFYWGFCLIVVTTDIFYKSYQMQQIENEADLENEVQEAVAETKKLMVHSVTAISQMIDAKDSYTQEHSKRVAEYARLIAQHMEKSNYSEDELALLYRSALLHDIGKIAVPDAVLNKPERLTDEEYDIMKKHTVWGREILSGLAFLPKADLGAAYHHERYEGGGYPYGIKSSELPEMVRIISAADALDAMNSNRCYRKQCDREYIIGEFERGSGKQFDADVAATIVKLIQEGSIAI